MRLRAPRHILCRYEGSFAHGLREGEGTHRFADGSTYVGTWKADKRSGLGVLTMPNGDKYNGACDEVRTRARVCMHACATRSWA
ncbi:hypothetical protein EON67_07110, partial [archaeon]